MRANYMSYIYRVPIYSFKSSHMKRKEQIIFAKTDDVIYLDLKPASVSSYECLRKMQELLIQIKIKHNSKFEQIGGVFFCLTCLLCDVFCDIRVEIGYPLHQIQMRRPFHVFLFFIKDIYIRFLPQYIHQSTVLPRDSFSKSSAPLPFLFLLNHMHFSSALKNMPIASSVLTRIFKF